MKRIVSLLLSLVLLLSITAGIDLSAYAIGGGSLSYLDPLSNKYVIPETANQFDFFENYLSIESMKRWANGDSFTWYDDEKMIDKYAEKIGIIKNGKPIGTEYERIAKIYQYMHITHTYDRMGVSPDESLIVRTGRCETLTWEVNELCQRAGIECWEIAGPANHAWNVVKIDGKYYAVDVARGRFLTEPGSDIASWKTEESTVTSANSNTYFNEYTGSGTGVQQWIKKVGSSNLATSTYPKTRIGKYEGQLINPSVTLATPTVVSTTATSEGVIVKWNGVANADWYEVWTAPIDGVMNNVSIERWDVKTSYSGDFVYYKSSTPYPYGDFDFMCDAYVHSIDKNESGQYQCFVENADDNYGKERNGILVFVVAKNVNGQCNIMPTEFINRLSEDTKAAMSLLGGKNYLNVADVGKDKNTGKTVEDVIAVQVNSGNYALHKKITSGHSYVKAKTVRTAGAGTQGAEVYECKNCLQREMRYTAAKSLSTPKLSSVSNVVAGVKVSWGKVSGAVKYRVFYKANGEKTWHKAGDTTSTSYTWTKAKNNTKYSFTVRCITSDGKTYTSSYDNTGKSITFLSAPTVKVSNVVAGVKVSWGKVSGAVNYKVYRKTPNGTYKTLGTTTGTSFTDKTAKNNTKYVYAVRCVTKDGKTTTSSYNPGKSITFLSAPTVKVSNVVAGVKISWNKVSGAVNYKVYRKTPGGSYKALGTTTGTSFTDKTAKNNTKYVYAVRCVTKDGKTTTSSYNPGKSITFLSAPKVTVSKTSSGVQVKWGKVTGAVNYKVYRKTAGGSYKAIGTTTGTSYVDKTAKKGMKYTYAVRCVTKNGKTTTSSYNAGKSITK